MRCHSRSRGCHNETEKRVSELGHGIHALVAELLLLLHVRYLPAEGDLGGDWYDIFMLPSGKVGLVMGDVEGHGVRSAVVMGRLRSALRAYASSMRTLPKC